MKLYMGYDESAGSSEGACLIVAHTAKEAKIIGYPDVCNWFDTEWIDMRANLIKENTDYLMAEVDIDNFNKGIPHVVECPTCCPNCGCWGGGEIIDGRCDLCRED